MAEQHFDAAPYSEFDIEVVHRLYSLADDSLAEVLADSLSIESLNFTLAGIFDGYSLVLFNEWLARAGPFPYTYSLYKLVYEDASFTLEDIVKEFGEDGLSLTLRLPFDSSRPNEEIDAVRELLAKFFGDRGLLSEFEKALASVLSEAAIRGHSIEKAYSAFIAHMINRALNEMVISNGTGSRMD